LLLEDLLFEDLFLRSAENPSISATLTTVVSVAARHQARLEKSLADACHLARMCEEFRGKETVVLDLTAVTPIMDFFVITTCNNPRTMAALASEARVQMKLRGNPPPATEGERVSSWLLQDWGDIVLHIMLPEPRALYDLEGLWADARRVDWKAISGTPLSTDE
jgi:ribosome-associated protein